MNRRFSDFSASLGITWSPGDAHLFKANIGRSFRLPGANELSANGVHHGTFRHEQGDPALSPERGWQLDLSHAYRQGAISISLSPFVTLFSNYIHLYPTGEWSALPHAGQIYRYTGARVFFAGAELSFTATLPRGFSYRFAGEHVYTRDRDGHTPLSFSPPATMRHTLAWNNTSVRCHVEWQHVASKRRVAKNEDPTPGTNLFHAGATVTIPLGTTRVEITCSVDNLLNTRYYNHLSFYRKVEIPEPGRDARMTIKIPLKRSFN